MADSVIKDRDGIEIEYVGATKVKLNTVDGDTQIFSEGEAVEGVEVSLDFSNGDQTITAPDGKLVKSAIIKKPDTLVPENIALDTIVAGVVGTFESGNFNTDNLVEIVPVTFVTVPSGGDGTVPLMEPIGLKTGSIYQILWNNVSYILEAKDITYNGIPAVAVGNGIAWGGEDNGLPFAIGEIPEEYVSFTGGAYGLIIPLDGYITFKVGGYLVCDAKICDVKEQRIEYTYNENGKIVGATPYGFTVLPPSAFRGITTLEWVDFSKCPNLVNLGTYAFQGCTGITEMTIPDSITNIGNYTFYGCTALQSITIPDGVTNIGTYAFRDCKSITSIDIPKSVTNIADYAFMNCTGLTSLKIDPSAITMTFYSFQGCDSVNNVVIKDGATSICDYAFRGLKGLKSITIPNGVTSIGQNAFSDCSALTSITIPSSVTSFGLKAFASTAITNFEVPDGTNSISNGMFQGCDSLQSVVIPDSVTSIDSLAFYHCDGLKSIVIPNGVTNIGDRAFQYSALTSATFKTTSGWKYYSSETATSGSTISATNLSNTSTAATYLKTTYADYWWKRT